MTGGTSGQDPDLLAVYPQLKGHPAPPSPPPPPPPVPAVPTSRGSSPHGVAPGVDGRPVRPVGGPNGDRDRHRGEEAGGYQPAADRWNTRKRWHASFPSAACCVLPVGVH